MTTQDFLGLYDAKVAEYLLALTYLMLFVPMWRYVQAARPQAEAFHGIADATQGIAAAAQARALARGAAPRPATASTGWFHAPDGVALHPGHAWARVEADGLVTVGIDDFAQKLVDPQALVLPRTGDQVLQGQPAFAVGDRVVTVPMLAPVGGEVVAVNALAAEDPKRLEDPYGAGWLFKVKVADLAAQGRRLLEGDRARQYLERAAEALALRLEPELGHVLQDGGTPIHGIARALAGDGWAGMARHYFHTDRSES
jgi:glycine cleavage system H lipoate-binding protein